MQTVTKIAIGALIVLCVASVAAGQAADGKKLVMGSVFRVIKNLIEVKVEDGDVEVIHVSPATSYINSSTQAPAKLKDISVGDQIVVKVITKNGVETADQVRFVPALGARN
jgi:hypothetical protein